jgi:hypothetical protein
MKKEGRLQAKKLQDTVRYWKADKPTFEFEIGFSGGETALIIGPSGSAKGAEKWGWLNDGTRAHRIIARRKPLLYFKVGGRSGSTPNSWAVSPSREGTEWRSARSVMHPGIRARGWTVLLLKERQNPYYKALNDALEAGMKKAMSK